MTTLHSFLNNLPPFARNAFAVSCGTTEGYLRKVISEDKTSVLGPKVCNQLEIRSGGVIKREELRSKDYFDIWPDLMHLKKKRTSKP